MSTKPKFGLDIIDGENALALLGQLIDIARGADDHNRMPFKVTVRHDEILNEGMSTERTLHQEAEINLWVFAVGMADPSCIEIRGFIPDDMLNASRGLKWLGRLLRENHALPWFSGDYDVRERTGVLQFEHK